MFRIVSHALGKNNQSTYAGHLYRSITSSNKHKVTDGMLFPLSASCMASLILGYGNKNAFNPYGKLADKAKDELGGLWQGNDLSIYIYIYIEVWNQFDTKRKVGSNCWQWADVDPYSEKNEFRYIPYNVLTVCILDAVATNVARRKITDTLRIEEIFIA